MDPLPAVFNRHRSDKGPAFHNYSRQYEPLLQRFRDKEIRILEIGVLNGESLKIWRDAFPNAKVIVGVDITPDCAKYANPQKGIFVEIANASKKEVIDTLNFKYGPFDLILDDGSHMNTDVFATFEGAFPLLQEDGLYIVEDTICYKSQRHLRPGAPNHLDYFTKFVPFLNQWREDDSTSGPRDNCVDPFKIQKKSANPFERGIDKIEFGCSYIAVHKKTRFHWA